MTDIQLMQDVELFQKLADKFSLIPLNGKAPFEEDWQKYCVTKREFKPEEFEGHNAGICCGPASNLLVLDIDDPKAFEALCEANGLEIPKTYTVHTGTGKPHYYFKYPEGADIGNRSLKHPVFSKHTIFDIRGNGGQVVAAGSIHPDTGEKYEVHNSVPGAAVPEWLLRYINGEEINTDALWDMPLPEPQCSEFVESLNVSDDTKQLILDGKPEGERSEAIGKVTASMLGSGYDVPVVTYVFDHYPIGEKYRGKDSAKGRWLGGEIDRARDFIADRDGQGSVLQPHEQAIQELNEKHSVLMLGGKCVIMNEVVDPVFDRPDINFSSTSDFKHFYANKKIVDPNGQYHDVSKATVWLDSPDRREYKGIVFAPQQEVKGYYNLFRGFDVEPKEGDWSLFKEHIWVNIADKNNDVYKYVMFWMAHLVQHPGGKRPGTAIVLRGKQGTGKGCFVSEFGKIFGSHFVQINSQKQVTGRFNKHLKDVLLVFVDEGVWAGDKSAAGVLKGQVTEDTIMVEAKGKDAITVKNHMRLIVASNNDWVIPAGMEERRFFVLDVSDKNMQDREYFGPIFEQMNNGGREAMLYDLLKWDISDYDLRKFPRTQALMDQIINSMSPIEKFWYECLINGEFPPDNQPWEEPIGCDEFYKEYIEFASKIGGSYKLTGIQVGKELKRLCSAVVRKKKTASRGERPYHYYFPPFTECRKHFEKLVHMEIDWTDGEEISA